MKNKIYRLMIFLLIPLSSTLIIGCNKSQVTESTELLDEKVETTNDVFETMTPEKYAELTELELREFKETVYYTEDVWEIVINDQSPEGKRETYPIIWEDVDITEFPTLENINKKSADILSDSDCVMYEAILECDDEYDNDKDNFVVKIPLFSLTEEEKEKVNKETFDKIDEGTSSFFESFPEKKEEDEIIKNYSWVYFNIDENDNRINTINYNKAGFGQEFCWEITTGQKKYCDISANMDYATDVFCERTPHYKVIYYGYHGEVDSLLTCYVYLPNTSDSIILQIYGKPDAEIDMREAVHNAINKLIVY